MSWTNEKDAGSMLVISNDWVILFVSSEKYFTELFK